jgi:hypothetical protein
MSAPNAHQCCVWDNYKYAMYTKFREPKLYRYAAQGDWDLIPHRCKTHPKEATFVHNYAPRDTALSRMLRTESCGQCSDDMQQKIFEMKHQAVVALLDANASVASFRDTFQRTPLHWACMDVASNHGESEDSILLLLLDRAPQAVHMTDVEHRTPLHYLVARSDEIPLKLLAKLVALCPEALSMKDEVGETPLDIIQSRKSELNNVDDLIRTLLKLQSMLTPSAKEVLENV